MAPELLFDISEMDLNHITFGPEEIEKINPQRGAMRLLDGVNYVDDGYSRAIGYKDVRDDEFWVPGHIPGRPLYPGVLMIETAAQLAAFLMVKRRGKHHKPGQFIGFVGTDDVKFRNQVTPGQRLYIIGHELKYSLRRMVCAAQGVVDGSIVFEAKITGMPI